MEIAVISGKGGTGKSSIVSAFITLAGSCVAVDCDVDASNLYLLLAPTKEGEEKFISGHHALIDKNLCSECGDCLTYCRFDAIEYVEGKVAIDQISCEGCFLCSRICPTRAITMIPSDASRMYWGDFRYGKMVYGRLAPGEENSGKLINILRSKARQTAQTNNLETIILDGPPGISCPAISTITGVNKVVIVTEPTVSGVSDLKRTVELARNFDAKIYIVINKFDLNPQISDEIDLWSAQNSLNVVGHLPFDKRVVDAMVAGRSIVEYQPDAEISTLIKKTFSQIMI